MKIKKEKLFKLNSPFFIISTLISTLLILLFGIWTGCKVNALPFHETYGGIGIGNASSQGTLEVDETQGQIKIKKFDSNHNQLDDFKILSISDTHFHNGGNDFCLDVLDHYISKDHPDLVVLCGDNIYRYTELKYVNELVNFFEERNQYWTFVLGNHDGEGWVKNRKDPEYWNARKRAFERESGIEQGLPHNHCLARCLIKDDVNQDRYGYGTNRIDLIGSDNQVVQSLFFFDCMSIDHPNQYVTTWLSNQILTCGDIMVFNHKPFVEMDEGYSKIGQDDSARYIWGRNDEPFCPDASGKSGLFEALSSSGKNPLLIFGHDHINNMRLTYKNVDMMYTLGLSYNSYCSRKAHASIYSPFNWAYIIAYVLDNSICNFIDGASEYIVAANQPRVISNQYAQFSGVLDGLKTKLYKATNGIFTYGVKGFTISLQVLLPISAIIVGIYWFEFGLYWWQKNHKKQTKRKSAK